MPSTPEISRTIYESIEKCHTSPTPLECLAEEVGKVGGRRHWTIDEIELVTEKAVRMLGILLEPAHEPSDNAEEPVRALRLHSG